LVSAEVNAVRKLKELGGLGLSDSLHLKDVEYVAFLNGGGMRA
jgi:hypothetical protein